MSNGSGNVCGRTGCGRRLRSNNTTGVCGSNCLSREAPETKRAPGVDGGTAGPAGPVNLKTDPVYKRFCTVASALGKDPNALLLAAAASWLTTVAEAVDKLDQADAA